MFAKPRRPGNFMCRICQTSFVFVRAVGPGRTFRCDFCRASRKALAFESDFAHKLARFALALVRARRDPGWRGPRCGARVPPNEAGRASRKSSIPHARIAQLEGQMTVNHRVAGSTPAPALRFSLKS